VHCTPHSLLARLLDKVLHLEEVEPQISVGLHPQVPLADCHKDGGLRDGVRGKVMELYLVVMQELPHEPARWHPEPPLVEGDEAHHVALRGCVALGGWTAAPSTLAGSDSPSVEGDRREPGPLASSLLPKNGLTRLQGELDSFPP
jgi:hypothetical protein